MIEAFSAEGEKFIEKKLADLRVGSLEELPVNLRRQLRKEKLKIDLSHVFGPDCKFDDDGSPIEQGIGSPQACRTHPVTQMVLENGIGHLSDDAQALAQCNLIEERHGKAAADVMRKKVSDYAAMKAEEAKLAAAQAQVKKDGMEVPS